MRALAAGLLLAGLLATGADAQVYHWVDDQGVIHYTTGIESVPERYRPTARVMAELGRRTRPPTPAAVSGGGATIPFTPGAPILVSARINGGGAVALILDTGAERTLVAPAALARLGVSTPNTYDATIQGVTGATRADVVWIQSLEVGGDAGRPARHHRPRRRHRRGRRPLGAGLPVALLGDDRHPRERRHARAELTTRQRAAARSQAPSAWARIARTMSAPPTRVAASGASPTPIQTQSGARTSSAVATSCSSAAGRCREARV